MKVFAKTTVFRTLVKDGAPSMPPSLPDSARVDLSMPWDGLARLTTAGDWGYLGSTTVDALTFATATSRFPGANGLVNRHDAEDRASTSTDELGGGYGYRYESRSEYLANEWDLSKNKLQWWRYVGGGEWAKLEHPENLRLSISERQILGLPWAPWFGHVLGRAGSFDTSGPIDGPDDGNPFSDLFATNAAAGDGASYGFGAPEDAGAHWYRELVAVNPHKPIDPTTKA